MLNARNHGLPISTTTWILVANRSGACLYRSDGGTKNLSLLKEITNPEGRLKDRQIETDWDGASMAEGSADFPMHGLVNKHGARAHVRELFATSLAALLEKGRAEAEFQRLVLICEPKFLGELRARLDAATLTRVVGAIDKDLAELPEPQMRQRVEELLA